MLCVTEECFVFEKLVYAVMTCLGVRSAKPKIFSTLSQVTYLSLYIFLSLSSVSWRYPEEFDSWWCAASHSVWRWVNSGWKV